MTRDGISTKDWARVHEAACAIVNASSMDDDVLHDHHTARMSDILDELEETYGRVSCILDTRADYTENPTVAIALYEEALAVSRGTFSSCLVLPSLIRLKIAECHDLTSIAERILEFERLIDTDEGSLDLDEIRELRDELRELQSAFGQLKRQNRVPGSS